MARGNHTDKTTYQRTPRGSVLSASSLGLRRFSRRVHVIPRMLALCVVVVALLTLLGTRAGWATVSGWLPHTRYTAEAASVAFLLGGISLWVWTLRPLTPTRRWIARGLAIAILVTALVALIYQFALYFQEGREAFTGAAFQAHPSRMPPFTIIALLLYGFALAFPDWMYPRRRRPAENLALMGTLLGFTMALAIFYRFSLESASRATIVSSLPASILMLLLGIGIITSHPSGVIGTLISNRGIAGHLTRRLFLLLLLSPPFLGAARLIGLKHGWFDEAMGAAFAIGAYIIAFGAVVLGFGYKLYLAEKHRRTTERRLISREFDARVAFNNAPVGIGQLNPNYRWVRINRQLPHIFGYDYDEFLSLPLHKLALPADRPACAASLHRLMAGEISYSSEECRFVRKDGGEIWCHLTITMPADSRFHRRYAIVVMEDITERKNAALEVIRQKAAAEAANRAKDRFISVISHELRTPLTPVLATLTAYPRDRLNEEQQKILNMMQRNIEHEVCLIDDLLEVTRLSHGKLTLKKAPTDLHLLLSELFELLANSFQEKHLSGVLALNARRHNVLGDRSRLRQVFLNLLDNARKFTPPGGSITLSTEEKEGKITIRVTDTGAGIPPDAVARIFEAFEQGDHARSRQFGGLGLGLAICKGLVEGHGGAVKVHSKGEGSGATFSVTLDTIDEAEAPRKREPLPEPRHGHILLVEDHADTRYMLHHLLERRGHKVIAAASMTEALQIAEAHKPELLLSDIGLPDGDGLTLPALIHERCQLKLPAIALSGFGNEEDRHASAAAGYSRHLVKPIDIRQLERAIHEVLAMNQG